MVPFKKLQDLSDKCAKKTGGFTTVTVSYTIHQGDEGRMNYQYYDEFNGFSPDIHSVQCLQDYMQKILKPTKDVSVSFRNDQ